MCISKESRQAPSWVSRKEASVDWTSIPQMSKETRNIHSAYPAKTLDSILCCLNIAPRLFAYSKPLSCFGAFTVSRQDKLLQVCSLWRWRKSLKNSPAKFKDKHSTIISAPSVMQNATADSGEKSSPRESTWSPTVLVNPEKWEGHYQIKIFYRKATCRSPMYYVAWNYFRWR